MAFPFRVGYRLRGGAIVVALSSIGSILPFAQAHADPPPSVSAAEQALEALSDKAELLIEQYDAAQDQLAAAQRLLAARQAAVSRAESRLRAAQDDVATVAVTAYRVGGSGIVESLLVDGDPQRALQRAQILALLVGERSATLRQAKALQAQLLAARKAADQQVTTIGKLNASLAAQRQQIEKLVARQERLVATARQAAARRAEATRRAAALAAQQAASRASRAEVSQSLPPVAADGRAAAAVRYAYAQLGKPYRYGAAGPSSFDCSGLTMRAWEAAGVSLPHNAAAQYAVTRHVPLSNLQPGDLIFFGHPIHHVGIYIGGGQMIEAPYTGSYVRINSFGYRDDIVGASRP
ncbi:MAG: C40 family peptidase [Acidothermus sp.]|nr:C40 family peptidase [Acidothermus sp.]